MYGLEHQNKESHKHTDNDIVILNPEVQPIPKISIK